MVSVFATDEGGGIGEVILLFLLVMAVFWLVAGAIALVPLVLSWRHGWRWRAVVLGLNTVASLPFIIGMRQWAETMENPEGLLWWSLPAWLVVAVLARRGPRGAALSRFARRPSGGDQAAAA